MSSAAHGASRPIGWRGIFGWLAALCYVALIWFLSSQVFDFKVIEKVPLRDKGVHFVEYGVLAVLFVHAFTQSHPSQRGIRVALAAIWLTLTAGMMDELHQAFVYGRSADAHDLLADMIGAALFATLYVALRRLWRARSRGLSRS